MQATSIKLRKTGSISSVVTRSFLMTIFLFISLMLTYRVLLISVIPEVELVLEAVYEVILVLYFVYRVVRRVSIGDFRFNLFELYIFGLILLPIFSALAALREFGQPIFYGLASQREFYLFLGALVVYNMLRTGEVTIKMVERAFLATAWFSTLMFYFMTLFTDPSQYIDTGLAGANDLKGESVFYRFNMVFIFFGSIYYSVKAFLERKPFYLAYAVFFAFYAIYFRLDRTTIAVMGAGLVAYFIFEVGLKKKVAFILASLVPGILIIMSVYLFADKTWEKYELMFMDAFATTTGGVSEQGYESIRIYEAGIARQQIEKNPFWGNGSVSQQWVPGGYNYFFRYFYASDVGYLGQIFLYGFLGAAFLYGQYLLALYYILRIRYLTNNVFLSTLKFFLLALALDSITTGYLTVYSAQTVTVVMLLCYFFEMDRKAAHEIYLSRAQLKLAKVNEEHG